MRLPEATSKAQYRRNVAELVGVCGLALLFLGPLFFRLQWRAIEAVDRLVGVGFQESLLWMNVLFVGTLVATVWGVFKAVELWYRR
ncbi:hypothetical protein ACNS7O_05930 [Haloferacaceae archaeon DSL9]